MLSNYNIYTNKQFNLIKIAWDYFDRDQDGFIARQEFHNFMGDDVVTKKIGLLPAYLIDPIFDDIPVFAYGPKLGELYNRVADAVIDFTIRFCPGVLSTLLSKN